jgi:2-haloacid dehalogenase
LPAYLKATRRLGLKPSESMMVAAHDGDLAAARTAGLHTALVSVPEEDNMAEGFGSPVETNFDIEVQDFDALCRQSGV